MEKNCNKNNLNPLKLVFYIVKSRSEKRKLKKFNKIKSGYICANKKKLTNEDFEKRAQLELILTDLKTNNFLKKSHLANITFYCYFIFIKK